MDARKTLPISDARKKIFDIANDVQKPDRVYTLTEKGIPKAVIMSVEEFESWQETLEVAKEFPDLKADIARFERLKDKSKLRTLESIIAKAKPPKRSSK